jgi:ATP-binding cassette subfamily B protein
VEKQKPKYNMFQNTHYMMKRYARDSGRTVAAVCIQAPARVAMQFLAVLLPSVVIGRLANGANAMELVRATALVAALLVAAAVIDKLCDGYIFGRVIYLRLGFIADVMYKNFDADYAVVEHPRTRELAERANRFLNNNTAGSEQTLRSVRDLGANLLGLSLYALLMARLSLWVLAGLIAISAVNYIAVHLFNRYEAGQREAQGKIWNRSGYLAQYCADFEAGKDIRIYNIAAWFGQLGERVEADDTALAKPREMRRFISGAVGATMLLVREGWVYVYLIGAVASGRIGISDFVLFFGVVAGFSGWISGISTELTNLNRCSLECCDFRALLELPDRQNRGAGIPLPGADEMPPEFTFTNVRYSYPGAEKPAVDIPELRIPKGQKLAIVGRNGAGKTTLVKLLTGIYMPDTGAISVNDHDSSKFNRDEYYDLFTAVFQDFVFLPGSIALNVALAREEEIDRARVMDCLTSAGLTEKIRALPHGLDTRMVKEALDDAAELSGGEQQRLVLARALYKGAPVLVLDEPTAALDPIAESDLYQKYADFARGHTSVFISHRLASTRFCDRILFIEDGKIAEDGTHDELMAAGGKYRAMFDIQSHYYKEAASHE